MRQSRSTVVGLQVSAWAEGGQSGEAGPGYVGGTVTQGLRQSRGARASLLEHKQWASKYLAGVGGGQGRRAGIRRPRARVGRVALVRHSWSMSSGRSRFQVPGRRRRHFGRGSRAGIRTWQARDGRGALVPHSQGSAGGRSDPLPGHPERQGMWMTRSPAGNGVPVRAAVISHMEGVPSSPGIRVEIHQAHTVTGRSVGAISDHEQWAGT